MSADEDEMEPCEQLGHDDYVREENDDLRIFGCHRCGAEWWEGLSTSPTVTFSGRTAASRSGVDS